MTESIGIRWFDPESDQIHFLYEYEHGERLQVEPMARSRRAERGDGAHPPAGGA